MSPTDPRYSNLPGWELVEPGLRDLSRGVLSVEAWLVLVGAPRLERAGLVVPRPEQARGVAHPEHRLYELLAQLHGDEAHARYNALVRRLVSFEHALELMRRPASA